MKSFFHSLSVAPILRCHFLHAAFSALIAAALVVPPSVMNAQTSHKPTSKVVKPLRNERLEPTAPTGQSTVNTGSTIQQTVTLAPIGPAWRALGPTPIPNGQTVGSEV